MVDNIIKFRSKSKDKRLNNTSNIINIHDYEIEEDFVENDESHLPLERRKTLSNKLKCQFEKTRIKNLNNPDKLEDYNDNKFIRGKGTVSKNMDYIKREIRKNYKIIILVKEKMKDKGMLAANIIEDFSKQDSWQSYTTLLFADVNVGNLRKTGKVMKQGN